MIIMRSDHLDARLITSIDRYLFTDVDISSDHCHDRLNVSIDAYLNQPFLRQSHTA